MESADNPALGGFSECDELTDPLPVRQGDVFVFLDEYQGPWARLGIVVTADCDIALHKHAGILSYVPVLELTEYLQRFVLPRQLERASTPVLDEVHRRVRELQAERRPEFPDPLADDAIDRWVKEAESARIADDLCVPDDARPSFAELIDLAKGCLTAGVGDFDTQFEMLRTLRGRASRTKRPVGEILWDEIRERVRSLPGDAFFLNALTSTERSGYVAYLRLIREINETEIALRPRDLHMNPIRARRVARLRSPYVYRLTQQLAQVFSAIGLPTDYEDQRDNTVMAHYASRQVKAEDT
ncbi:MAG TPA: hypothetical protein VFC33_17690 [Acidimicrobiia bacterium]|nr:hypothetical protein [Acidimicrobiia bacterium]